MSSTPSVLAAYVLSIAMLAATAAAQAGEAPTAGSPPAVMGVTQPACLAADLRQQSAALRKSILRTQRQLDEIRVVLARLTTQAEVAQSDRDDFYGAMQALSRALRVLRVDGALFTQRAASCSAALEMVAKTLAALERSEQAIRALHVEMIRSDPRPQSIDVALQGAREGVATLRGAEDSLLNRPESPPRTAATDGEGDDDSAPAATTQ